MIERAPIEYITENKDLHLAEMYCQFLDIDGKKDWRLPSLYETTSMRMMFLGGVVPTVKSGFIWHKHCRFDNHPDSGIVWPVRDIELNLEDV